MIIMSLTNDALQSNDYFAIFSVYLPLDLVFMTGGFKMILVQFQNSVHFVPHRTYFKIGLLNFLSAVRT